MKEIRVEEAGPRRNRSGLGEIGRRVPAENSQTGAIVFQTGGGAAGTNSCDAYPLSGLARRSLIRAGRRPCGTPGTGVSILWGDTAV